MNGAYGEGPLAVQQLGEMIWKTLELGAWLFIATAALWIIWRVFRA